MSRAMVLLGGLVLLMACSPGSPEPSEGQGRNEGGRGRALRGGPSPAFEKVIAKMKREGLL